jgi:hypothetical protein
MSNPAAAQLIAEVLPALTHPGDGQNGPVAFPLPMFRSSGIPADQADMFAKDAGLPHSDIAALVGEALVAALEAGGMPSTPTVQLQQLELAAASQEHRRNRTVPIHCQCGVELFTVAITDFDTDKAKISPQVVRALRQIGPECALGHQPAEAS